MSEGHTDFAAAFRDGATFMDNDGRRLKVERLDVGELEIRSGTVALGDPFTEMGPAAPPQGTVARGRYRVDLSVVRYPEGDRYVAAARLTFRDAPVAAWVKSELAIAVEGEAGFADGRYEAGRMIREITKALGESYVNAFSRAIVTGPQGEVAAFSTGVGGGEYGAFWGMTADAEPAQLCLDFEVLIEQRTEDVELALPLRRGEVATAALQRYGARASVPLLAPTQLKVTFRAPNSVVARWKGEGPLQPVPTRAHARDGVTFDLSAPPAGATLVLRVAIGWQRLREAPDEGTGAPL
jgi:hypothetical protein